MAPVVRLYRGTLGHSALRGVPFARFHLLPVPGRHMTMTQQVREREYVPVKPAVAEWPKFAVKAVVFVALGLIAAETFWRALGYMPGKSDFIHFAAQRKAADKDRAAVALVGSSRVRFGL